jgi:hypothetical protein
MVATNGTGMLDLVTSVTSKPLLERNNSQITVVIVTNNL